MPRHQSGRYSDMARRLRALEHLLGFAGNSAGFADRVGIGYKRWRNFLCGYPLSQEAALQIVQAFPQITLDYLLIGRTDGLPGHLARALEDYKDD